MKSLSSGGLNKSSENEWSSWCST